MKLSDSHKKLVEGYRKKCDRGWASGPDDGYFFQKLPYHMNQAGLESELISLLMNFEWLEVKIRKTDITSLLADYNFARDNSIVALLRETIQLSAHIIGEDHDQLGSQLIARLDPEVNAFLPLITQIKNRPSAKGFIPYKTGFLRSGGSLISSFSAHKKFVSAVAVSPDGQIAVSADGSISLIWETGTGQILHQLSGHSDRVTDLEFVLDGTRVVSCSLDLKLILWNVADGRALFTILPEKKPITRFVIDENRNRIITLSKDSALCVWQIENGDFVKSIATGLQEVSCFTPIAIIPASGEVVIASKENIITVWSLDQECDINKINVGGPVRALSISPDSRFMSVAVEGTFEGDRIKIWNLESNKLEIQYGKREDYFEDLAFSSNGSQLISASFPQPLDEKVARVWVHGPTPLQIFKFDPPNNLEPISELHGHIGGACHLNRARDCNILLSFGHENLIRVWDINRIDKFEKRENNESDLSRSYEGRYGMSSISSIAIDADNTVAISISESGTIRIWDLKLGQLINQLEYFKQEARIQPAPTLCMVPGGKTVLVTHHNTGLGSAISELNWETGKIIRSIHVGEICEIDSDDKGMPALISSIVLTDDGLLVGSCFYDELLVWNFQTGERLALIRGGNEPPWAPNLIHERYPIALLPDGRRIVWGNTENELQIIDIITGDTIMRTQPHEEISDLKVLPDGNHVITSSYKGGLFLWNIKDGKIVHDFKGHTNSIEGFVITSDGECVISCSEDLTIRAWHLSTIENIETLESDATFTSCALSPDERILVVGNRLGGVDFIRWIRK